MKLSSLWTFCFCIFAFGWQSNQVAFCQTADEVLRNMEKAMSPGKDSRAEIKMTLIDADGSAKVRSMKMIRLARSPEDYRIMKFTQPAEVRGVGFLAKSDTEMYLYMPEFRKIRRIASHAKSNTFMGTDFSYQDLSKSRFSDDYRPTIKSKSKDTYVLELIPLDPDDVDYSKLIVYLDSGTWHPKKIEFYDKNGKLWKVMTQGNFKTVSGYLTPTRIVMKDLKKNHTTVMEIQDIQFNTGLTEKDFTKRKLKRFR